MILSRAASRFSRKSTTRACKPDPFKFSATESVRRCAPRSASCLSRKFPGSVGAYTSDPVQKSADWRLLETVRPRITQIWLVAIRRVLQMCIP
ncbi:hypothetical protein BaRGS_00002278 [Batillaria attramentaria]|uniref:Uncharacterized protein n=1 Tax=Batillaria attramentaria TaxID=370345 RepID=A0ABD0M3S2_9CAEN